MISYSQEPQANEINLKKPMIPFHQMPLRDLDIHT